MKKKLLSLLLVLMLVIGVTAFSVMAEDTTTPASHENHCVCGGKCDGRGDHVCADSGVITEWTAFSEDLLVATDNANRFTLPAGNYYLTGDTTLSKELIIQPDAEVTFCLNGFELVGNRRVFRVNGTLNITDCQPKRDGKTQNGKITGNSGTAPVFYTYAGGHINLYRGILTAKSGVTRIWGGVGALGTDEGVTAAKGSSSMTMYGGTIDASKLTITKDGNSHGNGGAVVLFGATVDLDGDDVKETTYGCTFVQYGGTIKGAKSVEGYGTAIYGNLVDTIKILGNTEASGTVTGEGAIAGSTGCTIVVGSGAKVSDLYMRAGQTFTTENLTGSVGLSTPVTNAAALTTCTEAEAACFTSKVAGRSVISTEVEGVYQISLGGHTAHCDCGGNLTGVAAENHTCAETTPEWTALTAENIVRDAGITVASDRETDSAYNMFAADGHYYLSENIELDKNFEIRPGQNITLCLNGYTLSTAHSQTIFRITGGTLTICDCTGEGTVKSTWTGNSPLVYLLNGYADATEGCTFNLYGGTLKATDTSTAQNAGAIQISNNNIETPAVMNMYGGTVTGGKGKVSGNINMVNSVAATLNIYGGTISNGKSAGVGGNINCTSGTINMYAGTITGGTATTQGGNVYLNNTNTDAGRVAVFNLYGGSITGGTAATRGGNIYINKGTLAIYGGKVTGGTLTDYQRGLDIGMGANDPVCLLLDGEVTIGEIGVHGNASDAYAMSLGENFTTKTPIAMQSTNLSKIIKNTDATMLKCFTVVNENAQLTYENGDIWMRSLDDHYACRCGGAHIGASYHGTCNYVKWTALTSDLINGYTYQETTETTDETTGETTTTTTDVVVPGLEDHEYSSASSALAGTCDILPAGFYYLTGDLTLDQALFIAEDTNVYIDLNGHTLTVGEDAMRAFMVKGELSICDSAFNASAETVEDKYQGCIVGTPEINYNVLYALTDAVVRIYGGDISTAVAKGSTGQGPVGVSHLLYLFDGTITGTEVTGDAGTIAINDSGDVVIYNGKVSGGVARRGGNIFVPTNGSLVVNGGEIVGGHAYGAASGYVGGGGNIYAAGNVTVNGGTISGGTADRTQSSAQAYGGNIYSNNTAKSVKITGGIIDGGTAVTGGNIFVRGTFEMTGGTVSNGIATGAIGGNVRVEGNIENATGVCNITGGTFIGGTAKQQGGSLILRNIPGEIIIKNASFTGGVSTESHGGNIYMVGLEGNVVMENVTIADGVSASRGGNLYITADVEGVTATLTNVTMTGGQAVDRGGNMYFADVACTMTDCTVTGGAVIGSEGTNPADVYGANIATNTGNFATSLVIDGGNYGSTGENNISLTSVHVLSSDDPYTVTVTGAPVIDDLRLGTDRMLTVGELTEGAAIGISRFEITGIFAPGAAQYASYFTGVTEGTSVAAEGEDLILVSSIPYWAFDVQCNVIAPAATVAEAMAMENASFVRLVSDYASTETYEGELYLDLYGHDLSGLTVNGNLYVVDYATNDYEENVAGSFSGTVSGAINGGKTVYSDAEKAHFNVANNYVKIANADGSYGFHRVSVSITHVSLKAADDALGFKATVKGDSLVQAAVTGFGFNMGIDGLNMVSYSKTGTPTDGVFTLRLKNILKNNGGELTIVGQPVIFFGEESVTGGEKTTSMKKTIEAVEKALVESAEAYTQAQVESVQALIALYESKMEGWDIDTIKQWAPSTEEVTPAA